MTQVGWFQAYDPFHRHTARYRRADVLVAPIYSVDIGVIEIYKCVGRAGFAVGCIDSAFNYQPLTFVGRRCQEGLRRDAFRQISGTAPTNIRVLDRIVQKLRSNVIAPLCL